MNPPGNQSTAEPERVPAPPAAPVVSQRIDLRLHDINQLFHSLDPSPFREKDLDTQAEEFIVGWARELPAGEPLRLTIHLTRQPAIDNARQMVSEAVRNYFAYRADTTASQYRELLRQGWRNLGIGLLFVFTCLLLAESLAGRGDGTFIAVLRESLIIGGWVAMWRPMEMFLYDRWPLKRRQKLFERLSNMEVLIDISP
jgi:hypothetical protein